MTLDLPKAILVDLDDTILDDSSHVFACWREACTDHRSELTVHPNILHDEIERTRAWYWSDPERHREGRLDLEAARGEVTRIAMKRLGIVDAPLVTRIASRYGDLRHRGIQPIEGAIETLEWIRDQGCKMALLTNGNAAGQRGKVTRFQLEKFFDVMLIEGELGFGKPDPRVYGMALQRLDTKPGETWMVGDNLEWDVAAPQRLGIFGIWIDADRLGVPAKLGVNPDRIIHTLSDLRPRTTSALQ